MKSTMTFALIGALGLLMSQAQADNREAVGTAFTYQGRLELDDSPVDGPCDFYFELWDVESGGSVNPNCIATYTPENPITVTDGLFTVVVDFGTGVFEGDAYWLDISVRCPPGGGPWAPLPPRQRLTPAPNALYAGNAGDADTLDGYHSDQLPYAESGHNHMGEIWVGLGHGLYITSEGPSEDTFWASGGRSGVMGFASGSGWHFCRGVYGAADGPVANYGVLGATSQGGDDDYGVYYIGGLGGTGKMGTSQPHPRDASKEVHAFCMVGNESGTYFRGSSKLVNGKTVIDVPEEFRLVTDCEGLTVQVTAMGPKANLWIESKNLERIVVRGEENVEFDYFVNGVRRGYADVQLIRENHAYVPEVRGVPYGTQYPEALCKILVDNGILNPDYTPNEQTAARLGWTLKEPHEKDTIPHVGPNGDRAVDQSGLGQVAQFGDDQVSTTHTPEVQDEN